MKFRILPAIVPVLGLAGCLAGCITTQELPLAPNVVRLDTQAGGLLFTGQTVPATMRAAAKATLAAGYTHFRLSDASSRVGSRYVGTTCGGGPNMVTCTDISGPTAAVGVTVTMLKASDPDAKNAFDARAVLAQYGS